MQKFILITALSLSSLLVFAQSIDDLSYGTDNSLEIISWNIQTFPLDETETADYITQLVPALDADIIAVQEVYDVTAFTQMADQIPGYEAYVGNYDDWVKLAYIYKSATVQVNAIYEIFTEAEYDNPFLRKPYVLEITWSGDDYVIINNHFKAMGDGILDTTDVLDEENRRYQAVNLLKDYIDTNFANDKVVVLGDMNDILTDEPENNVFQNLFSDPGNYAFADYEIATGDQSNWSYPGWPSHIDHILITNELFPAFYAHSSSIETLEIENYLTGGISEYNQYISDHRPLALKLFPDEALIFNKDFEDQSLTSGGWTAYSVTGDQEWYVPTTQFGHNDSYCAYMSGYESGANVNEDWLISPAFNSDAHDNLRLSFWNASGYSGSDIQLFYSEDFAGDPETATWEEMNEAIWHNGETNWEWTFSGLLDLSAYSGTNAHIGFKYTSPSDQNSTWELDDIMLSDAANSFIVSADVNMPEAGTLSGAGDYVFGEMVSLSATAEDGYAFLNWTEEGAEVSAEPEYVFQANANRNLTANFEITNAANTSEFSGFRMYPNPTNGMLFFEGADIQEVEIHDARGGLLYRISPRRESFRFNLSDLPKGLYLVRLTGRHGVMTKKLVVK
ncbi:MAG: choice-of-anchor J domain-containing protein [Bacteroidales bacterium]